jgi:PadR family transcriptional regulator PadR
MPERRNTLPQGTLDLLIVRTLVLGPNHGSAISERDHQVSGKVLQLEQGSLYPPLHRLERRRWIKARWAHLRTAACAKYYEPAKTGRKQLEAEMREWAKLTCAVSQVSETASGVRDAQ